MGFFGFLGNIAKAALPIAGGLLGGPAGLVAGLGAAKAIGGIGQGNTADALEKQNIRPVDAPESEYLQNVAEANNMAQNGIASSQYNSSLNNIQRNQNFALRSATNRGGGLAALSGIIGAGNDAYSNLGVQDQIARERNLQTAFQQRRALALRKQQAFDWNDKQKFLENASAIRALRASSSQNIWGGLTSIGSAALGGFGGASGSGGLLGGLGKIALGGLNTAPQTGYTPNVGITDVSQTQSLA